mmetsp:Transcript_89478/g.172178  ORF Transcript_89478/g.172178 Transcript_89478/m.172178 type:complete len:635 (+) Transcript_89478:38-1942(+)
MPSRCCLSTSVGEAWYSASDVATSNVSDVPRLPIPDFDKTIAIYLSSVKALSESEDKFLEHAKIVDAFASENGIGRKLDSLVKDEDSKRAEKHEYPYSYIEAHWDDMYLGGRYASPINVNPSYLLNLPHLDKSQDRFEKLARYTLATLSWHAKVMSGRLDRGGGDVCFSPFAKQLGAARIPAEGRDLLELHPWARHVVVFCGTEVYSLDVLNDEGNASLFSEADLQQALADIYENVLSNGSGGKPQHPPLSLLTATSRDRSASSRAVLTSVGNNAESIRVIDTALLSIALDLPADAEITSTSLSTAALVGDVDGLQPRWFDKHQLLSLENGELGYNFEHSYSDGMSWNRMISEVAASVQGLSPPRGCQPLEPLPVSSSTGVISRVDFELDDNVRKCLQEAAEEFGGMISNLHNVVVDFTDYGKDEIKTWKQSPDAVVQLALMLAFARLHPNVPLPSVYEACSVSKFFHGRTETIRSLTEPAAAFLRAGVAALGDDNQADVKATLQPLMAEATAAHKDISIAAASANGIDRHLLALQKMAERKGVDEPLFAEPLWQNSKAWKLSTSNVTADFVRYFAFGAVDPDGYGIGYTVNNDAIPMNISCYRDSDHNTDAQRFGDEVRQSLLFLKDVATSAS